VQYVHILRELNGDDLRIIFDGVSEIAERVPVCFVLEWAWLVFMRGGRHEASPRSANQRPRLWCCDVVQSRVHQEGPSNFKRSSLLQSARKFQRFERIDAVAML